MMHNFNVDVAKEVGIEKAIILNNFYFWIVKNIANNKNIHNDKCWTYNSYEALVELFPYLSYDQIKKHILKLEKDDILVSNKDLNANKWDKTKWYSFGKNEIVKKFFKLPKIGNSLDSAKEDDSIVLNGTIEETNPHHRTYKSAPCIMNNNQRQIINTDNKPNKNNTKKDFSFSLSKSAEYENLSAEYKELLSGYATCKDGAYSLDEFLDYHIAKGSTFKDWSRAYNTWISNAKKYNKYEPNKYLELFTADVTGLKIDSYARYGTDKLYDPKSLKIVATYKRDNKRDNKQQQAETGQIESNPMEMMKSLANSVRVS